MSVGLRYRLTAELLEDLHSGTGTTSGHLDGVQTRARNGRPVIRDSHLIGLMREAGFEVARLDPARKDDVATLFGEGGGARRKLVCRSLRTDTDVATLAWTSSSRRLHDRGPRDDLLRTREHVPAGTRFVAEMNLHDASLAELLERTMRRVTHLGARRRRDTGRIVCSFDKIEASTSSSIAGKPEGARPRLRLVIRLLEPACFGTAPVPENFIPTECFMRGQLVLGAFANWALDHGKPAADLMPSHGAMVFGVGLPLPEEPSPGPIGAWEVMPIALDMKSPKPAAQHCRHWPHWAEDASPVTDAAAPTATPPESQENQRMAKLKRPGPREFLFRSASMDPWQRYTVPVGRHMRNNAGEARRRNDPKSALYAREELLEDTAFLVDLTFSSAAIAESFVDRFGEVLTGGAWLTLGRGGAPAMVTQAAFLKPAGRQALPAGAKSFRLTLLSDLVARGPRLGFLDTLDAPALAALAGKDPDFVARIAIEAETDTETVHGFNASSGLPRLAVPCVRRGSVITCKSDDEAALGSLYDALRPMEALGERQSEGFGAFRLDAAPPVIAKRPSAPVEPNSQVTAIEARLTRARTVADAMGAVARARRGDGDQPDFPGRSQWQGLLEDLRGVGSPEALAAVLDALALHAERQAGACWKALMPLLHQHGGDSDDGAEPADGTLLRDAIGYILRDDRLQQEDERR